MEPKELISILMNRFSSGSSGWVRGLRNMKSMQSLLVAFFYGRTFTWPGGGAGVHGPLAPLDPLLKIELIHKTEFMLVSCFLHRYSIDPSFVRENNPFSKHGLFCSKILIQHCTEK